jgi:hypothetical protein
VLKNSSKNRNNYLDAVAVRKFKKTLSRALPDDDALVCSSRSKKRAVSAPRHAMNLVLVALERMQQFT